MNNDYVIIDNFLSVENFTKIRDILSGRVSSDLNWGKTYEIIGGDSESKEKYMHVHVFFNDVPFQISNNFFLMAPIISQLNILQLHRIKSNRYPRTKNIIQHDWHTDRTDEHFSAIYYVNTNNGKTIIKDIVEIESIENRFVIFKGNLPHASTTADDDQRLNINFNFKFRDDYNLESFSYERKIISAYN